MIPSIEQLEKGLDEDLSTLVETFGEDELNHLDTTVARPTTPLGNLQARIEGAMRVLDLTPEQVRMRYAETLKKDSK